VTCRGPSLALGAMLLSLRVSEPSSATAYTNTQLRPLAGAEQGKESALAHGRKQWMFKAIVSRN